MSRLESSSGATTSTLPEREARACPFFRDATETCFFILRQDAAEGERVEVSRVFSTPGERRDSPHLPQFHSSFLSLYFSSFNETNSLYSEKPGARLQARTARWVIPAASFALARVACYQRCEFCFVQQIAPGPVEMKIPDLYRALVTR